jgi:hypothetical protein
MHFQNFQTAQSEMSTPQVTNNNYDAEMAVDPSHLNAYIAWLDAKYEGAERDFNRLNSEFEADFTAYERDERDGNADVADAAAVFFDNQKENAKLVADEDGTSQLIFERFLMAAVENNIRCAMDESRPPSNMECDAMLQVGAFLVEEGYPATLKPRFQWNEMSPKKELAVIPTYTISGTANPIFASHGMFPVRISVAN